MNPDIPLQLLGGLSARQFLRDYWQKRPLLIRQAVPGFESPVSPDELAGLSLEEEVESRLVIEQGQTPWELRHGPFDETTYQQLPEQQWTLLVQAVDQWVPEVAELKQAFQFLPTWRMDDVMISYAAPGGGVGPHYDNYDVFLLQGYGQRRWRIGQLCDGDSLMAEHPDLKILADFQQSDEWVLEAGDMLYLPPRIAHDGVALTDCMTYSFGFRAPGAAEVLTHFTDFLAQFISDDQRYNDPDLSFHEDPARIQTDAIKRLKSLMAAHLNDDRLLMSWFGQYMTEPRYPDQITGPEVLSATEVLNVLQEGALIAQNPCARLAWAEIDLGPLLFASGQSRLLPAELTPFIRLLCAAEILHLENLMPWLEQPDALCLLTELLKQGSLRILDEDETEYD